jgi:hypothetical protein
MDRLKAIAPSMVVMPPMVMMPPVMVMPPMVMPMMPVVPVGLGAGRDGAEGHDDGRRVQKDPSH